MARGEAVEKRWKIQIGRVISLLGQVMIKVVDSSRVGAKKYPVSGEVPADIGEVNSVCEIDRGGAGRSGLEFLPLVLKSRS